MSHNDAEDYAGLPAASARDPQLTITFHGTGYDLVIGEGGREGIRCRRCTLTSYNPNDIQQLYCGFCHEFHPKGATP